MHTAALNSNSRASSDSTDVKAFWLAGSRGVTAPTPPDTYLPRHGKEHKEKGEASSIPRFSSVRFDIGCG